MDDDVGDDSSLADSSPVLRWDFDVFEAPNLVGSCAEVLWSFFPRGQQQQGNRTSSRADDVRSRLLEFVEDVRRNMQGPPYHNFYHGADVLLMTSHFLRNRGGSDLLSEVEAFGLAIAAMGHDVCHPGLNNAYHVNAGLDLAIRYSDVAVLEAHSAAVTWRLLRDRKVVVDDLDDGFGGQDGGTSFRLFRKVVVSSILATDMAGHSKLMSRLKTDEPKEDHLFVCETLLHLADLSNPARPWKVSKKWADRIQDEFFKQGDLEKERGLPVSPNMDRESTPPWKLALGFSDFIVQPFFDAVPFLDLDQARASLAENRKRWLEVKQVGDDGLQETTQKDKRDNTPAVVSSAGVSVDVGTCAAKAEPPVEPAREAKATTGEATTGKRPKRGSTTSLATKRRSQLIDAVHKLPPEHHQTPHQRSIRTATDLSFGDVDGEETKGGGLASLRRKVASKSKKVLPLVVLKKIWKSRCWTAFIIALVIVSLLLDAVRRGFLAKASDPITNVVLLTIFVTFVVEILTGSLLEKNYAHSFIFYANLIGAASLLVDVPWLLGHFFQAHGATDSVRAARVARLTRFLRLSRATFVINLVDFWALPKEFDQQEDDGWAWLSQASDGGGNTSKGDKALGSSSLGNKDDDDDDDDPNTSVQGGSSSQPQHPRRIGKRATTLSSRVLLVSLIVTLCAMPFADPSRQTFQSQRQLLRAVRELEEAERLAFFEANDPTKGSLRALYLRMDDRAYVPRKSRKIQRRRTLEKHRLKVGSFAVLVSDDRQYQRDLARREVIIMIGMILVVTVGTFALTLISEQVVVRRLRETKDLVERSERLLWVLQKDVEQSTFETDFIETSIAKIAQLLASGSGSGSSTSAAPRRLLALETTRVQGAFVSFTAHEPFSAAGGADDDDDRSKYLILVHHVVRSNSAFFGGASKKNRDDSFLLVFLCEEENDGLPDDDDDQDDRNETQVVLALGNNNNDDDDDDDDDVEQKTTKKRSRSMLGSLQQANLFESFRRPRKVHELFNRTASRRRRKEESSLEDHPRPDWGGLSFSERGPERASACDAALSAVVACLLDAAHLNALSRRPKSEVADQLRAIALDDYDDNDDDAVSFQQQQQRAPGTTRSLTCSTSGSPAGDAGGANLLRMVQNRRRRSIRKSVTSLDLLFDNNNKTTTTTAAPERKKDQNTEATASLIAKHGACFLLTAGLHFGWALRNSVTAHESYTSPHVHFASKLQRAASTVYGVPLLLSADFAARLHTDTHTRRIDRVSQQHGGPVVLRAYDFLNERQRTSFPHLLQKTELTALFDLDDARAYVDLFDRGLQLYLDGRWAEAQLILEQCLHTLPGDAPGRSILTYMARSQFVPPSDWRGYRTIGL